MAKLIDGKALSQEKEAILKKEFANLKINPKVVSILVGDDPNSQLYTNMKQKKAAGLGINFVPNKFPEDTSFSLIASEIIKLNADTSVIGIMIQLPLPKPCLGTHQTKELVSLIDPKKDIDGLNPDSKFMSATVRGVIAILEYLNINYQENKFAVVGSEGEVGKPMVNFLEDKYAKVIKVDKKIEGSSLKDLKEADVVIGCTGANDLIKPEVLKDGFVGIDVGLGDFDPKCYPKSSFYTPKFGGVGPMTIISLMENILEAAKMASSK